MERRKISYRQNIGRLKHFPSVFCAECLFPFDDRRAKFCKVCGSTAAPISIYERVKRDRSLSVGERCMDSYWAALIIGALLTAVICAVRLAQISGHDFIGNGEEFILPALFLQILPALGGVYMLFKRDRLLGWLFFIVLPFDALFLLLTREPYMWLISGYWLVCAFSFFKAADAVEMYEPFNAHSVQPDIDKGEWKCDSCGYINGAEHSQCRSCEKYRRKKPL